MAKRKIDEVTPSPIERDNLVIKSVFVNNDALLKTIRALFLGLPINEGDKQVIRDTFKIDGLRIAFRNRFLPELNRESLIGQASDIWLGVEEMVFGMPRDTIRQAIEYKAAAIELTEQALALLENPDGDRFSPAYSPNADLDDELAVGLLARNQYIRHVEKQLLSMWVIANKDTVSPEEMAKRLRQGDR